MLQCKKSLSGTRKVRYLVITVSEVFGEYLLIVMMLFVENFHCIRSVYLMAV